MDIEKFIVDLHTIHTNNMTESLDRSIPMALERQDLKIRGNKIVQDKA
jgi:hypothetical protein